MAKRALLIGSPFENLRGPLPDVERVAQLLARNGFEDVQPCVGDNATRNGIIIAYRALIDSTGSEDVVTIYYSGHGARALDETYTPPNEHAPPKRYNQFIVPMDLDESSEGDFRGILNLELSSLLAQLTAKTNNVTVIFDCCHSGGMTRDLRLTARGLSKEWFAGASNHFQRFTRGEVPGFPMSGVAVEGNPHAVRLMAALPSQQAWEYEGDQGAYGLMTDALIKALTEAGDRAVTWDAIKRRVRELVQRWEPGQYPDVEGPSSRFVFELNEAELTGVIPIEMSDDGLRLQGGHLLGVGVGDKYVVMPPGSQKVDRTEALGSATVKYVSGAWSSIEFDSGSAPVRLPPGALAFPASRTYNRRPVIIRAGTELRSALTQAIAGSELVQLPGENESGVPGDALAVVEEGDGQLLIREQDNRDLIAPLDVVPGIADKVVENLDRLARARRLEALESGTGSSKLTAKFELEWGRVVDGVPRPLEMSGGLLHVGERIFVRVRNTSSSTLYVSVFDIGLAGKITLLTRNYAPSGVELQPGGELPLGYREPGGWKGLGPLSWPKEVPKDARPRPESLVVVVSDRPQDLRALESPGMAVPKGLEAERSELERIADQDATGRTRDFDADAPPPEVRYSVQHISMLVDPTDVQMPIPATAFGRGVERGAGPASLVGTIPAAAVPNLAPFLIDERPQPSAAYRRPRGPKPPSAVAVQLGEIVVHSNRAVFSTDVRVDALVITGGKSADGVYRADTAKFQRIKDGDRLPLDNLLVYHGPVSGFVDLAVWMSRDDDRSLSLADMLKEQLGTAEFKEAALVLAGMAVAAPTAGAIVAGLGAATSVTNIAYKLLSAAVGKSIGLYRTSLLANEGFGVGRHPMNGTMRAQDFSFWYQVSKVK